MPKVSVIMGIYNCADVMSSSIDSIINQTFTDWELIMCDDGSADDTYEVALKYVEKDPRIKVIKNDKNMRLAYSLNQCLKIAQGEYIARMDADDISLPHRFERQVAYLDEHPEMAVVASRVIVFDETGDKFVRSIAGDYPMRQKVNLSVPFIHPTIMMRKSAYNQVGGYTVSTDTMRAEDLDLWYKFRLAGLDGYNIQEPLLKYHESLNDMKKRSLKAAIGMVKINKKYYKLLNVPLRFRFLAVKPLVSAVLPNWFMIWYHSKK